VCATVTVAREAEAAAAVAADGGHAIAIAVHVVLAVDLDGVWRAEPLRTDAAADYWDYPTTSANRKVPVRVHRISVDGVGALPRPAPADGDGTHDAAVAAMSDLVVCDVLAGLWGAYTGTRAAAAAGTLFCFTSSWSFTSRMRHRTE
jgi:hypothetical protein